MKKIFPFVVVLLFHCGCASNHSEFIDAARVLKCDIENTKRIQHLSEISDSVSIIKIETNDSTLIGDVDKLLCCDSLLYLQSAQKIFLIDFEGNVK